MKITLTFDPTDDSLEEVQNAVVRAYGSFEEPAAEAVKETAAAAKKRKKAEAAAKADTDTDTDTDTDGPTRNDVRDALKAFAALEDKDAAIAILKKHGANSIGELDEDEFVAVIEEAS